MIINHPSRHHQLKAWQTGGVHVRTLDAAIDRGCAKTLKRPLVVGADSTRILENTT